MAQSGEVRTIVTASAALSVAVLPVFLVGALSDAIRSDLGIGETSIGAAITVLLGTAGLTASLAGRLTERFGAPITLRVGVLVAGVATAAVGAFAERWWQLALAFGAAGFAVGLIDTGAARTFVDRVRDGRRGSAFGLKEASVPAASLLAGIALPTLGVAIGWRWTFVAAFALPLAVVLVLPRSTPGATRDERPPLEVGASAPSDRAAVLALAVAVGLGSGAANAAATFLAPSATATGASAGFAGTLLAGASLASIAMRIGAGRWADEPAHDASRLISILLLVGVVGATMLAATSGGGVLYAVGAVLLLSGGWGWTGLAFLAAVRARPHAPAAAAATVLAGIGLGGAFGPLAFGGLVEVGSYGLAWAIAAAVFAVAGVLTVVAERLRVQARGGEPSATG